MRTGQNTAPAKDVDELTIWRGAMYRALALAFTYPDPEVAEQLAVDLEALCAHPLSAAPDLAPAAEALRGALAVTPVELLAATHNQLFAGEVPCSPYETEYEFDAFAKARQLADIAGFYRAFGLKVAADEAAPADFIATELEFMSHLAVKQVYADVNGWEERASVAKETQKEFLEDHLGHWAPLFCRTVAGLEEVDSFYGAGACLADAFITREIEALGAHPSVALVRRASRELDDQLICPMAAPAIEDEEDLP